MRNLNNNQYDFINLTENALLTISENYDLKTTATLEVNDINEIATITKMQFFNSFPDNKITHIKYYRLL